MEKVVGKVLLDHIPFITQTNDELIQSMGGVDLHNMPKDWLPPDFDHGLGPRRCFLTDTGAQTSCQDNYFHSLFLFKDFR